jgi:hemolysin activation/secretion protein
MVVRSSDGKIRLTLLEGKVSATIATGKSRLKWISDRLILMEQKFIHRRKQKE